MPRNESSEVFKALHGGAPPSPFNKRIPGSIIDNNGMPPQELLKAMHRGGAMYDPMFGPNEGGAPPNPGGRWGAVPPLHADPRLMAVQDGMPPSPGAGMLGPMPLMQQQHQHQDRERQQEREMMQLQQPRMQLEPINIALAGAAGRTSALEDRVVQLEHRLLSAERTAAEAIRALDIQTQRVASLSTDFSRAMGEVSDLRLRYEEAHSGGAAAAQAAQQLAQQLVGVSADVRAQEGRLAGTAAQLGEALRANAELRGHMAVLSDEVARGAQERAVAQASAERLARQFTDGAVHMAEEARRQAEAQDAAAREDARRRQAVHHAELAALQREVEMYRSEAAAAGAALHSAVERVNARVHAEEALLERLRNETAQQAQHEAAVLGNLRGQVSELQSVLVGLNQQVATEQAMRRAEAQAMDFNVRNMEAQLLSAQDQLAKRTQDLMENKSTQFAKAMQDLEAVTAQRDEETRLSSEQQLSTVVRATVKKDRAGVERMMVIESAVRDVATASAMALAELQIKIDKGVADVALMVDGAKRATEDREAALREQINTALQKVRAYARDMEESLEQERLKLEEVVKMEIKARMGAVDHVRDMLSTSVAAVRVDLEHGISTVRQEMGGIKAKVEQVAEDVAIKVLRDMRSALEEKQAQLTQELGALGGRLAEEESARRGGIDQLQKWFDQNQADQKVTEELIRAELEDLNTTVQRHKEILEERLVDEVAALQGELDKQKSGLKAERLAREELAGVVAEHAERHEDEGRKIETLLTRTKQTEMDLAGLTETTTERLAALDAGVLAVAKGARKELQAAKLDLEGRMLENKEEAEAALAAARKQLEDNMNTEMGALATRTEQKLIDFGHEMETNQAAIEAVIAETGEEAAAANRALGARVDEMQAMLEDEVAQMEEMVDSRISQAKAAVDAQLKAADEKATLAAAAAAAELAASLAAVTTQLAEADEKLEQSLQAADQKLVGSLEEMRQESEARLEGVDKQLQAQGLAMDNLSNTLQAQMAQQQQAQQEALAATQQQVEERLQLTADNLGARVEQAVAEAQDALGQLQQETAARQAEADQKLEQSLQAAEQKLEQAMAQAEQNLALGLDNLGARIDQANAAAEHAVQSTQGGLTEQLLALRSEVEAAQAAQDERLREAKEQLSEEVTRTRDEVYGFVEAAATDGRQAREAMQAEVSDRLAQAAAAQQQLQEQLAQAEAKSDSQFADASAAMAAAAARQQESLDAAVNNLTQRVEGLQADVEQRLETASGQQQEALTATLNNLTQRVDTLALDVDQRLAAQEQAAQAQREELVASAQGAAEQQQLAMEGAVKGLLERIEHEVSELDQKVSAQAVSTEQRLEGLEQALQRVRDDADGATRQLRDDLLASAATAAAQHQEELAAHRAEVSEREHDLNNRLAQAESNMTALVDQTKGQLMEEVQQLAAQVADVHATSSEGTRAATAQLEERLQALNADVGTVRDMVVNQTGEMANILDAVSTTQATLEAHESRMSGADHRLDMLQSKLEEVDAHTQGLHQSVDALGTSVDGLTSKQSGSSKQAEALLADADARLTALAEQLSAAREQLAHAATSQELADGLAAAERKTQLLTDNLAARIDQAKAELEHASQSTSDGAQQMVDSVVSKLEHASLEQAARLQQLQQQLDQQAGTSASSLEALRGEVASLASAVGAAGAAGPAATEGLKKELEAATQQLKQELDAQRAQQDVRIKAGEEKAAALDSRVGVLEGSVKETATAAASAKGGLSEQDVEKLISKERAETSTQLDSLRSQMQGEGKELVKQGLAQVKAEVSQEVRQEWDERAGQLLGSLERTMHKALDESLDKMKETVADHIGKEMRHRGL